MWQDLLVGIALLLVFEGVMPFLSPTQYRRTLLLASRLHDKSIRTLGLISMVAGVLVLYLVR
jgi:uncharacterized protein YjeT (DUF2065 family)